MRRFFLAVVPILAALALLAGGAGYVLAQNGIFSPGSPLYPLQDYAEMQRASLTRAPQGQASYALDLLERRTEDLAGLANSRSEVAGLDALSLALDQAVETIGTAPLEGLDGLKIRLAEQLVKIEAILPGLESAQPGQPGEALFAAVTAKTLALHNMVGAFIASQPVTEIAAGQSGSPQPTPTRPPGRDEPVTAVVAFPPGSGGAQHEFFPLYGKHAELVCQSCHAEAYDGTPSTCSDCHNEATPEEHYPGLCENCHVSTTWQEADFSHPMPLATDCQSCHLKHRPANHYTGQCSACHITTTPPETWRWKPANFNHTAARATDCRACHYDDQPANHYSAQCSACHRPVKWLPATFNHQAAGASNCQSCHGEDRPANHFGGQCSACHNTGGWLPARFNHQAAGASNCQSCHSDDRPANHFSGQCSQCHSTTSWKGATFTHSGLADCQSCHNNDKPANHYSGQCSQCHSTSTWKGASFSHQGLNDCQSCHSGDAPGGHWSGQCSQCHTPGDWGKINVSGHRFPMDHGDASGDCADCHEGSKTSVNCYKCHNQAEINKKHTEEGISDFEGRCLECHPTGNKD